MDKFVLKTQNGEYISMGDRETHIGRSQRFVLHKELKYATVFNTLMYKSIKNNKLNEVLHFTDSPLIKVNVETSIKEISDE